MDSEEEVDYMSDSFLASISGKADICPGLSKSHAQKYDHQRAVKKTHTDKINRLKNPSMKEKEASSREDGLSRPIDDSNIGFKMLQKLGFKPGSGLGKSGEGRVDPISVEVKTDRHGLGRQMALRDMHRRLKASREAEREKLLNVEDYRSRKAGELAEKKATSDLRKCQRVCWELDSNEGIDTPVTDWFWPECKVPTSNNDEDSEDGSDTEQTSGCVVSSSDDNKEKGDNLTECKVSSSESNKKKSVSEDQPENDEDDDSLSTHGEEEYEYPVQEKLEVLTAYLRRTHLYCVWCGHSFDDEKDLQQDCPGPLKEDH